MKYGIVYRITNVINDKVYIGQTIQTLNRRLTIHFSKNVHSIISRAIRKYGKSNFIFEEIYTAFDKDELNRAEIYFISLENCMQPRGYNIKEGGANGRLPEHIRKRIGLTKIGNTNNLGKVWSEEQKIRMAKVINKNYREILCTNVITGETKIYKSMHSASVDGFSFKKISICVNTKTVKGELRLHKNCTFRYINHADQNGSIDTNKSLHVQRLDSETITI